MDRCHLYLPLVDSSGVIYPFAEVTLLNPETGNPIDEPAYLDPHGGAPQKWPILIDPAVINLWTDKPVRVTVHALLPGGTTFTRSGVDVTPAPAVTVRSRRPLRIASAQGLDGTAMLAISPDGSAAWQVLDALRFHRHEGDAPESTALGMSDLTDIYPGQTWLGRSITGTQGPGASALGSQAHPEGPAATVVGRGTSGANGLAVGGAANAAASAVAVGAASAAAKEQQVVLGRSASAALGPEGAVVIGAGTAAAADGAVTVASGVRVTQGGNVILGKGSLPDMSWLGADAYVAILGNAVAARFFAARAAATLAGAASPLGFFGAAGGLRPLMNTAGITGSTPGRDALRSLFAALDRLGLVYLTDAVGTLDDELADWTKTLSHEANLVLESGDSSGFFAGDTTRVKRNSTAPGSMVYRITTGIRDFTLRAFSDSADMAPQVSAQVSADGTVWAPMPLAWQTAVATAAPWKQSWGSNARPLPAATTYLKLTLAVNPLVSAPQVGRVIVRPSLASQ